MSSKGDPETDASSEEEKNERNETDEKKDPKSGTVLVGATALIEPRWIVLKVTGVLFILLLEATWLALDKLCKGKLSRKWLNAVQGIQTSTFDKLSTNTEGVILRWRLGKTLATLGNTATHLKGESKQDQRLEGGKEKGPKSSKQVASYILETT